MNKHPNNRAERLKVVRIKRKKDRFEKSEIDRAAAVERRLAEEALEQKEALDVLRRKVPSTEEE